MFFFYYLIPYFFHINEDRKELDKEGLKKILVEKYIPLIFAIVFYITNFFFYCLGKYVPPSRRGMDGAARPGMGDRMQDRRRDDTAAVR